MALYAFDGTSNTWHTKSSELKKNTNVVRFFQAYDGNSSGKINKYIPGVGTRFGFVGAVIGGAFGAGELHRLHVAYEHLCRRWQADDRDIDVIGFSRGAATVIDFCNLIDGRGICLPGTDTVVEANPKIRFVGVWDVVAAFGLANLGLTDFNFGHHLSIPKGDVQYAFHALALDERRPSFLATRLRGAYEVWFRGVHADVGGGNERLSTNDISLKWMMCKAKAAGLPITDANIAALKPDPTAAPVFDLVHTPAIVDVRTVFDVDRKHYTVQSMPDCRAVPNSCSIETEADEKQAIKIDGLSILSPELENRVTVLASVAAAEARATGFLFGDEAQEALLARIHDRVRLVTNDQDLLTARQNTIKLVDETVRCAQKHQFHEVNEFFVTEALQNLRPIFPFVGDDE